MYESEQQEKEIIVKHLIKWCDCFKLGSSVLDG